MEENHELQQLLESKDFHFLTAEERKIVLLDITEEEYALRRKLLCEIKEFLQQGVKNSLPKENVKRNVLAVMQSKKQSNVFGRIVFYRLPVYIPAAATILVLLMIPFLFRDQLSEGEARFKQPEPKIIYRTKIIEKEVPKIVEVEKIKYVKIPADAVYSSNDLIITNNFEENSTEQLSNPELTFSEAQIENQLSAIGKSSTSHRELNQFLVVGR